MDVFEKKYRWKCWKYRWGNIQWSDLPAVVVNTVRTEMTPRNVLASAWTWLEPKSAKCNSYFGHLFSQTSSRMQQWKMKLHWQVMALGSKMAGRIGKAKLAMDWWRNHRTLRRYALVNILKNELFRTVYWRSTVIQSEIVPSILWTFVLTRRTSQCCWPVFESATDHWVSSGHHGQLQKTLAATLAVEKGQTQNILAWLWFPSILVVPSWGPWF